MYELFVFVILRQVFVDMHGDVMNVPNNQNDFHLFDLTFLIRGTHKLTKTHASDWFFCVQKSFFRRCKQKYLSTLRHLHGSVSCGVWNVCKSGPFFLRIC